jgi:hypothetical protein
VPRFCWSAMPWVWYYPKIAVKKYSCCICVWLTSRCLTGSPFPCHGNNWKLDNKKWKSRAWGYLFLTENTLANEGMGCWREYPIWGRIRVFKMLRIVRGWLCSRVKLAWVSFLTRFITVWQWKMVHLGVDVIITIFCDFRRKNNNNVMTAKT